MSKYHSSMYHPMSVNDDYLYYVEGYGHPTTADKAKKVTWDRNFKYVSSQNCQRRPYSSPYDQVLYSNSKFTADSSQGTIPYFDGEIEDRRLKNYGRQYKYMPYPMHQPKATSKFTATPTQLYSHLPNVRNTARLDNYKTSPCRYQEDTYFDNAKHWYSNAELIQSDAYSEEEVESETDVLVEEEYTESEDDCSIGNRQKPIQKNNATISGSKKEDDRNALYAEKLMKNINAYNRCQPGRKINFHDIETAIQRAKKEPVVDDKYMYKRARCLNSSYEKAAEYIKTAKSKGLAYQNLKAKLKNDCYNQNPYEQYRRKQYGQLLFNNHNTSVKNRDNLENVQKQTHKYMVQNNPSYSVLKPDSLEEKQYSPKAEKPETTETKDLKKPSVSEQPIKLQKEVSEPVQLVSTTIVNAQPEKTSSRHRLPILKKSKRIPSRKRNLIGINPYIKALTRFTEYLQISIQKQSIVSVPSSTRGKTSEPQIKVSEKLNIPPFLPEPQSDKDNNTKKETVNVRPSSKKCKVKLDVDSMLSKLDEIENLISSRNHSVVNTHQSSQSSCNIDTSTSISMINSAAELTSDNSRKTRRSCDSPIPEDRENKQCDQVLQKFDGVESNPLVSIKSTLSRIGSFESNAKSVTEREMDELSILKSILNLKYEDPISTSPSRSTTKYSESSTCKTETKNRKKTSETSSRKFVQRSGNASSIVTVFPASKRNVELTADSASTNLASDIMHEQALTRKKILNSSKIKRRAEVNKSSSENSSTLIRPRHKGKKRVSINDRVVEDRPASTISRLNSLRSVFCFIVDFLFRYFRNIFIL